MVVILRLLDTEITCDGVHGNERLIQPFIQASNRFSQVIVQENKTLRETLARLNERLNEPFVTVNTVTGDLGIKQAQDDYQRLMNNKSPKNKRK